MTRMLLPALLALACVRSLCAQVSDPAQIEFFEKKVRPLLDAHCLECHGNNEKKVRGGLRMTSHKSMLEGGDSGPSIVPGKPADSPLVKVLSYTDEMKMPPKGKLSPEQIAVLAEWVKRGALWPTPVAVAVAPPGAKTELFTPEQKAFWAFRPVVVPPVPAIETAGGADTPIDAFVLAKLREKGLTFRMPAAKSVWLRRATFDLTGLPPTVAELAAFLKDESPTDRATAVDRLLASPAYGERWARHWLDVVRYGDSNGQDENSALPDAFQYRDYVVGAFNADKPYAQFVREQLAGDLLPPVEDVAVMGDRLRALGMLAIGPKILAEPDKQKMMLDIADEQLDTVGKAFMGLTLGCARCHDHKFDPLPTRDYYSLLSIFTSTRTMKNLNTVAETLQRALPVAKGEKAATVRVLAVEEGKKDAYDTRPRNLHVQIRGNYVTPGEEAPPVFLRIVAGEKQAPFAETKADTGMPLTPTQTRFGQTRANSGRLQLADWIASPTHPLTARVMANRIWQHHFGEGLVRSVDNFGRLGDRPSHPELLDWLAAEFVRNGWSVKQLHRQIVLSNAYRQDGAFDPAGAAADPENRLLWRFPPQRLEAEAIRDGILSVSGLLDRKMGGSLMTTKGFEYVESREGTSAHSSFASNRRSLYLPVVRNGVYDFFQTFDFAEPSTTLGKRASTVVAPQALFLMNNPLVRSASTAFATNLSKTPGSDEDRIRLAFRQAYTREATPAEVALATSTIARIDKLAEATVKDPVARKLSAWSAWCQIVFASSEMIYIR